MEDRNAGCVISDDEWRIHSGRHLPKDGLRNRGNLSDAGCYVGIGLKEDLVDCYTIERKRFEVLDVVDGCREYTLVRRDHATLDLVGTQARKIPYDRDHWDIDVGKNVSRCTKYYDWRG